MTSAGAIWAATSTALSACFYLLDFGTTLSALRTYYYYEYQCPHVSLTSTLLRDRICQAIRSGHSLHSSYIQFWVCLSFLGVAHLTYGFIFWVTLDARHHPLRLAYFMPLIHLYRLLKVLYNTLSCEGVKELQASQKEPSSLYNALSASLETAPQFVLQFVIAMKLGQSVENSSNRSMQAQRIPTNLILSLAASLASGSYTASTAVLFLIENEVIPLSKRACLGILVGKILPFDFPYQRL
ncbi:hypothetical protein GOP47_0014616 [Adiantum capillus-veneris]|uniref:Uncharacterized protein n=1 Tax=Adiantum capillus-veneris TaxID=13818 RepID=A0A9D4ULU0_ADICA|nr:hypothetical protein GOP47_0014616 [Adiantum capillus-veneris]